MVELVTGVAHEELDDRPTVPNCMALHQRLVSLGIRWMPEYTLPVRREARRSGLRRVPRRDPRSGQREHPARSGEDPYPRPASGDPRPYPAEDADLHLLHRRHRPIAARCADRERMEGRFLHGRRQERPERLYQGRRGRPHRHQRHRDRRGRPATGLQPADRQRLALDARRVRPAAGPHLPPGPAAGQGDRRSSADLRDGQRATLVLVRIENAAAGVQEVHRRRRRRWRRAGRAAAFAPTSPTGRDGLAGTPRLGASAGHHPRSGSWSRSRTRTRRT